MNEQDWKQSQYYQEDFLASHSALPGSAVARMMTVTSGQKCAELCASCTPLGWSEKTSLELYELRLREFFPTCKVSATRREPTVLRLGTWGGCTKANGSLLWPRPTTGAPLCGGTHNFRQMQALTDAAIITEEERRNLTCGSGGKSNPALMEWLMGFPIGWTDLDA